MSLIDSILKRYIKESFEARWSLCESFSDDDVATTLKATITVF